MRLNLGSSDQNLPGWHNVDLVQPCDQIADLALQWPWEDGSIEEIRAADIAEHVKDCQHIRTRCQECDIEGMRFRCEPYRHWSGRAHFASEAWRVLKPGGILTIECPDAAKGSGQHQDFTHVNGWTPNGLQYFQVGRGALNRFAAAYGGTARFNVLRVSERMYEEWAGPLTGNTPQNSVLCQVWKWTAVLEAVK